MAEYVGKAKVQLSVDDIAVDPKVKQELDEKLKAAGQARLRAGLRDILSRLPGFSQLSGVANTVRNLSESVSLLGSKAALAKVAVAAVAVAMAEIVRRVAADLDAIGKAAQRFGMSSQETAVLRLASELADVPFEQVGRAVFHFQRRLSEAQDPASQAARTFAALGLSVEALRQLRPIEQLKALGAALDGLSVSDKIRVQMELFGRSGADLATLLADKGATLDQALAAARRTGLRVSEEHTRGAADFQDALTELKTAFGSLLRSLVTPELLHAIAAGFRGVGAVLGFISKVVSVLTAVFSWLGRTLAETVLRFGALSDVLRKVAEAVAYLWERLNEVLDTLLEFFGQHVGPQTKLREATELFEDAVGRFADAVDRAIGVRTAEAASGQFLETFLANQAAQLELLKSMNNTLSRPSIAVVGVR